MLEYWKDHDFFFQGKVLSKWLWGTACLKSLCCKVKCCRESCDWHMLLCCQAIYNTVYLNSSRAKEKVFQNLLVQGSQLLWIKKAMSLTRRKHTWLTVVLMSSRVLWFFLINFSDFWDDSSRGFFRFTLFSQYTV